MAKNKTIRELNSPEQNELLHKRLDDVLDSEGGSIILYDRKRITDLHIGYCMKHLKEALKEIVSSAIEYQEQIDELIKNKKK
jgi:hypothetical protein